MIGIDYYKTITAEPKLFKNLAESYIASGLPVYIITAVQKKYVARVMEDVKKSRIPHTHLEIIVFENYNDIPKLKLEACKRLGVKIMYDDMVETCELLAKYKIRTCQIR